ncbi:aconitate hydratase [Arthrobacter roseus]|uniref:aconitate hydratase n=1 Tax=Arthrobacter roseus TaxID=136274 RepID=UPI00196237C9|nr:aconitate hydratase [Arthrobacter roseus]MBM7849262.1 aconitate hydratase [Arthrobacter roseus]
MGPSTPQNVTQKIISEHLVDGEMTPGTEIGLRIDQTLTQDATGTMVMLELEAMGIERVQTELSAQYVDHNLLQTDEKNPEDHLFLQSAAQRYGLWFSKPGNGVSHPVHQARFGRPGAIMVGSDSHTCAAGAIGMLAIGVGGLEVAMAMAGEPLYVAMPEIWGVELTGELPDWVSAKDIILEMLRRHNVKGGVGRIIEYHGPGLAGLTAMDRHVIANMGAELGATTSVFPSDEEVLRFLTGAGRAEDFAEILADDGATYDVEETIDLSTLEPLIAKPSSPGNVVPVREVAGAEVYQVVVGSSANPGLRDFAVVAEILKGRQGHQAVSVDINPTSREILEDLSKGGWLFDLISAGARIHQSGCMGCIGMGQAPATGRNSLRTVPRNFPGRSGTDEDAVWLCSPETAAAAALTGVITDPRDLDMDYPRPALPSEPSINTAMLLEPLPPEEASHVELVKGSNIASLPEFDPLPDKIELPVLLKMGDNISTDEILPAGARVLPYRSNIPSISDFLFTQVDKTYATRAKEAEGGHMLIAGENYGQGSSREHAVIAPRYLGLRIVVAKSFARIHWQNLANFGVLALEFTDPADYDAVSKGSVLSFEGIHEQLKNNHEMTATLDDDRRLTLRHRLSPRQADMVLKGGRIATVAKQNVKPDEIVDA